jgi:hypothetical protein
MLALILVNRVLDDLFAELGQEFGANQLGPEPISYRAVCQIECPENCAIREATVRSSAVSSSLLPGQ